ncbi:hypothetical protein ACSLBF_12770 [Pseudoalteromonas sp. T1lg65]|uniref:hypothetical protein n=1 Tax=Pseudoalteromonas sp. T1lg65 TaxID=2077101 RepID=UPI003F7AF832
MIDKHATPSLKILYYMLIGQCNYFRTDNPLEKVSCPLCNQEREQNENRQQEYSSEPSKREFSNK